MRFWWDERARHEPSHGIGGPFDIILCPPCALPALTHGISTVLFTVCADACLYNLLGYQGSAGLPVGVQVVARPWREHVALAAMQAIEREVSMRMEFIPGGV